MPQPKSTSSSSRAARKPAAAKAKPKAAAKPAAKPKAAAKPAAKPKPKPKAAAAAKPAAARTRAAAKPKAVTSRGTPAAKPKPKPKPKARAASKPKAAAAAAIPSLPGTEQLPDSLAAVLDTLHRGVVLQRDRLQEVVDDAVSRGRMTRADAEDLVQSLMVTGRRQAEDIIAEVEKALDRGLKEVGTARRQARRRTAASPVAREVDRARRRIGVGSFPILGYDDLTAGQVVDRLADLTPAQLRKVRDHERRNANRKGVLNGIEKHLR